MPGWPLVKQANGAKSLDLLQLLPGMNSGEVFTDLCRTWPEIEVILTTAYSQDVAFTAAGDSRGFHPEAIPD